MWMYKMQNIIRTLILKAARVSSDPLLLEVCFWLVARSLNCIFFFLRFFLHLHNNFSEEFLGFCFSSRYRLNYSPLFVDSSPLFAFISEIRTSFGSSFPWGFYCSWLLYLRVRFGFYEPIGTPTYIVRSWNYWQLISRTHKLLYSMEESKLNRNIIF